MKNIVNAIDSILDDKELMYLFEKQVEVRSRSGTKRTASKKVEKNELIPRIEKILDEEIFNQIQKILTSNDKKVMTDLLNEVEGAISLKNTNDEKKYFGVILGLVLYIVFQKKKTK